MKTRLKYRNIRGKLKKVFYSFPEEMEDRIEKESQAFEEARQAFEECINNGTSTQHYWFYKLEYLLWKDFPNKNEFPFPFDDKEQFKYDEISNKYLLSRVNSIEHMLSRSRSTWDDNSLPADAKKKIDGFGNLALISSHMNSKLLNYEENKKSQIQLQLNKGTIESLKMLYFYSNIKESKDKTLDNSIKHKEAMLQILLKSLH
jgi:hypothetical protein